MHAILTGELEYERGKRRIRNEKNNEKNNKKNEEKNTKKNKKTNSKKEIEIKVKYSLAVEGVRGDSYAPLAVFWIGMVTTNDSDVKKTTIVFLVGHELFWTEFLGLAQLKSGTVPDPNFHRWLPRSECAEYCHTP
jgi:hypothetical protein